MDPAALDALPTEKAFKMELKRGQVPSAKTKVYIAQIQAYAKINHC